MLTSNGETVHSHLMWQCGPAALEAAANRSERLY